MKSALIQQLIDLAILEDIGRGDITTNSTVGPDTYCKGRFLAKESGVLAGFPLVELVFASIDLDVQVRALRPEGAEISEGEFVGEIEGPARSILSGERIALNFLQRLSGIATYARRLSEMVKGHKAQVVDTRKTTPGWRVLEKYAVRMGGASNHRLGLDDAVLIKDNHIIASGGIGAAVERARAGVSITTKIEVETADRTQVQEALAAGADIIMLDNMPPGLVREMVDLISGRTLTEASGRITEDNLVDMAATGVDFISIGALTHSYKSLDISLDFIDQS